MVDVIVIGGGVIGLSIARVLRVGGAKSVLLLDRNTAGEGASWAAAGMLTPQSETDEPGPFLQLCLASLRMYRAFVDELRAETGIDCGYSDDGLIYLASSEQSVEILKRRYELQRKARLNVEFLGPDDVRKKEPLVTAPVQGGLFFPDDVQVAPRRLVKALQESCVRRGVEIRSHARVDGVARNAVSVAGEELAVQHVVIASGVWSPELKGLDPPIPVHPRKGQILSLTMPGRPFRHMIRWEHAYFVPRPDGELVVGATEEDAGFDRNLTPAGLGRLLSDAQRISSHVGSYPVKEMWTGLRPATPDGLPIIGPSSVPGVFYATGHYRNGILLAPITASVIAAVLDEGTPPVPIESYSPARFADYGL